MTRNETRQKAKEMGVPFAAVQDAYRELRELQKLEREREWSMRQRAWERMTPPGCHEFWRHGFRVRYPRAFGEGDRALIRGFDVMADGLAYEFPELRRDDDPAATLYEFLAQPHNCLPTAEATWDQAFDLCYDRVDELEAAPF